MSNPRILLADDDPDIRAILRAHLETYSVTLFDARNGEEALEAILVEKPHLVVLDVMMPELNGWEICKYVRSKDELSAVRILMLTAIGERVNELTSPLYGADAYLDKPFDLDEIDATVRRLVELAGQELVAV
ncbi:MAG: DNA-binding response OmpR family regulator [Bradymonadia bacterium]|jgi:DNA-binding response OmpR family regulator